MGKVPKHWKLNASTPRVFHLIDKKSVLQISKVKYKVSERENQTPGMREIRVSSVGKKNEN